MKKKDILTGIYMQSAANNELTQKHIEVEKERAVAENQIVGALLSGLATKDRVDISKKEYLDLLEMKKDYERMQKENERLIKPFSALGFSQKELDELLEWDFETRPRINLIESYKDGNMVIGIMYKSKNFETNMRLRDLSRNDHFIRCQMMS